MTTESDAMLLRTANQMAAAGKYQAAIDTLEGVNGAEHSVAKSLLLAKISAQQGQYDQAEQHWQRVLEQSPQHPEAMAGLAELHRVGRGSAAFLTARGNLVHALSLGIIVVLLVAWGASWIRGGARLRELQTACEQQQELTRDVSQSLGTAVATINARDTDVAQATQRELAALSVVIQSQAQQSALSAEETDRRLRKFAEDLASANAAAQERHKTMQASITSLTDGLREMKAGNTEQLQAVSEALARAVEAQQNAQDAYQQAALKQNQDYQQRLQSFAEALQRTVHEGQQRYEALYTESINRLAQLSQEGQQRTAQGYKEALDRLEKLTTEDKTRVSGLHDRIQGWITQLLEEGRRQSTAVAQYMDELRALRQSTADLLTLADQARDLNTGFQKLSAPLSGWNTQERNRVREQLGQLIRNSDELLVRFSGASAPPAGETRADDQASQLQP